MFQGLFKWIAQPLSDFMDLKDTSPNPSITVYNGPRMSSFRPSTFVEYIGQSKAKDILQNTYMKAVRERGITMPHVLLYGCAGTGKTTLARIIANELRVNFREGVTSTLKNPTELISMIDEIDGGVLFLDEIHGIERSLAESIYSIMEDFKYNGMPLKPFTLIGATTELGELIATRRPFVDRFKVPIELADYTLSELAILVKQYKMVSFPHDILDNIIYDEIASNCRRTPRIAIRLLESCVYLKGDIQKVLRNFDIITQGYTLKDLEILKYIELNEKGVGLLGIASYMGTSVNNYTQMWEPYLLRNHLILRTPRGRRISDAGKIKIIELEKAKESA